MFRICGGIQFELVTGRGQASNAVESFAFEYDPAFGLAFIHRQRKAGQLWRVGYDPEVHFMRFAVRLQQR